MMHFWQSRHGDYYTIKIPYSIESSKQGFFPIAPFWKPQISYAWMSILKGWDLLLKGVRWRVGCGETITVWNDAWLPSPTQPRVSSQVVQGFEDIKVSDLIDPAIHKWDKNLLHGLFIPHEAELIASIPLCLNKVEDVVLLQVVTQ